MSEKQTEVVKFLNFLSNPNALSSNDLGEIKDWVEKYPYSQSLKFIAVKAAQKGSNYSDLLAEAATIAPSRKILHDLIHQPANFFSTILPFTLDDDLTVEERQIAVASEENLEGVEDKSKFTFGINLNEIYGSEYKIQNLEEESPVESIQEEIQEEEVTAIADDEQIEKVSETEEESPVESIQEEIQEKEVSAIASKEVLEEESSVEDIEEKAQEGISAIEDEEVLKNDSPIENIEEEIQANENEEVSENESSIENAEKEIQENEEVSANSDEEQVEEEFQIENIEEEKLEDEVSVNADEDQVEEIQDAEVEHAVENIEEETQKEEVSVIADEEVKEIENESEVGNIEEEIQEDVKLSVDETVLQEDTLVENIEEETQPEISTIEDEEILENESPVENIEDEIPENDKQIKKEEPAFQYAPQTDFFALNRKDKAEETQAVEPELKADESVSAYNDERMPYTFLWWLNKTRKEHANTQPYSSFKLDTTRQIKAQETDGLNHQIAENIFHLRGVEELSSSASNYTVPFDFRKKEFQIIEKFIKEEPQIRPPAANKIDSENKAKNSSEDKNQVVSETLAKIYVEQMLYHKALDVYKKLSLKFPEKSTYFASQIKYLELKVN